MEKLVRIIARFVGVGFMLNVVPTVLPLLPMNGVDELAMNAVYVFVYLASFGIVFAITAKK